MKDENRILDCKVAHFVLFLLPSLLNVRKYLDPISDFLWGMRFLNLLFFTLFSPIFIKLLQNIVTIVACGSGKKSCSI